MDIHTRICFDGSYRGISRDGHLARLGLVVCLQVLDGSPWFLSGAGVDLIQVDGWMNAEG